MLLKKDLLSIHTENSCGNNFKYVFYSHHLYLLKKSSVFISLCQKMEKMVISLEDNECKFAIEQMINLINRHIKELWQ